MKAPEPRIAGTVDPTTSLETIEALEAETASLDLLEKRNRRNIAVVEALRHGDFSTSRHLMRLHLPIVNTPFKTDTPDSVRLWKEGVIAQKEFRFYCNEGKPAEAMRAWAFYKAYMQKLGQEPENEFGGYMFTAAIKCREQKDQRNAIHAYACCGELNVVSNLRKEFQTSADSAQEEKEKEYYRGCVTLCDEYLTKDVE